MQYLVLRRPSPYLSLNYRSISRDLQPRHMIRDVPEPSHPGKSRSRPGPGGTFWLIVRISETSEIFEIFETHHHGSLLLSTECFRTLGYAETSYRVRLHRSLRPPDDYLN